MADVIKVNFGGSPFPRQADMAEAVADAIMQFEGEVPLMAVIGVLRLIEYNLLMDAIDAK